MSEDEIKVQKIKLDGPNSINKNEKPKGKDSPDTFDADIWTKHKGHTISQMLEGDISDENGSVFGSSSSDSGDISLFSTDDSAKDSAEIIKKAAKKQENKNLAQSIHDAMQKGFGQSNGAGNLESFSASSEIKDYDYTQDLQRISEGIENLPPQEQKDALKITSTEELESGKAEPEQKDKAHYYRHKMVLSANAGDFVKESSEKLKETQKAFKQFMASEGLRSKMLNGFIYLFGGTTRGDVKESIDIDNKKISELEEVAKSGDIKAFLAKYKELTGVQFKIENFTYLAQTEQHYKIALHAQNLTDIANDLESEQKSSESKGYKNCFRLDTLKQEAEFKNNFEMRGQISGGRSPLENALMKLYDDDLDMAITWIDEKTKQLQANNKDFDKLPQEEQYKLLSKEFQRNAKTLMLQALGKNNSISDIEKKYQEALKGAYGDNIPQEKLQNYVSNQARATSLFDSAVIIALAVLARNPKLAMLNKTAVITGVIGSISALERFTDANGFTWEETGDVAGEMALTYMGFKIFGVVANETSGAIGKYLQAHGVKELGDMTLAQKLAAKYIPVAAGGGVSGATSTALMGVIHGDKPEDILVNTLISGASGAVFAIGFSKFTECVMKVVDKGVSKVAAHRELKRTINEYSKLDNPEIQEALANLKKTGITQESKKAFFDVIKKVGVKNQLQIFNTPETLGLLQEIEKYGFGDDVARRCELAIVKNSFMKDLGAKDIAKINDLLAKISKEGLTAENLKSAKRLVGLNFHPDMHPEITDAKELFTYFNTQLDVLKKGFEQYGSRINNLSYETVKPKPAQASVQVQPKAQIPTAEVPKPQAPAETAKAIPAQKPTEKLAETPKTPKSVTDKTYPAKLSTKSSTTMSKPEADEIIKDEKGNITFFKRNWVTPNGEKVSYITEHKYDAKGNSILDKSAKYISGKLLFEEITTNKYDEQGQHYFEKLVKTEYKEDKIQSRTTTIKERDIVTTIEDAFNSGKLISSQETKYKNGQQEPEITTRYFDEQGAIKYSAIRQNNSADNTAITRTMDANGRLIKFEFEEKYDSSKEKEMCDYFGYKLLVEQREDGTKVLTIYSKYKRNGEVHYAVKEISQLDNDFDISKISNESTIQAVQEETSKHIAKELFSRRTLDIKEGKTTVSQAQHGRTVHQLDVNQRPNSTAERIVYDGLTEEGLDILTLVDHELDLLVNKTQYRLSKSIAVGNDPKTGKPIYKAIDISKTITPNEVILTDNTTGAKITLSLEEMAKRIGVGVSMKEMLTGQYYEGKVTLEYMMHVLPPTTILSIKALMDKNPDMKIEWTSDSDKICFERGSNKKVNKLLINMEPGVVTHEVLHGVDEMLRLTFSKEIQDVYFEECKNLSKDATEIAEYGIIGGTHMRVSGLQELIAMAGTFHDTVSYEQGSGEAEVLRLAFPKTIKLIETRLIEWQQQLLKEYSEPPTKTTEKSAEVPKPQALTESAKAIPAQKAYSPELIKFANELKEDCQKYIHDPKILKIAEERGLFTPEYLSKFIDVSDPYSFIGEDHIRNMAKFSDEGFELFNQIVEKKAMSAGTIIKRIKLFEGAKEENKPLIRELISIPEVGEYDINDWIKEKVTLEMVKNMKSRGLFDNREYQHDDRKMLAALSDKEFDTVLKLRKEILNSGYHFKELCQLAKLNDTELTKILDFIKSIKSTNDDIDTLEFISECINDDGKTVSDDMIKLVHQCLAEGIKNDLGIIKTENEIKYTLKAAKINSELVQKYIRLGIKSGSDIYSAVEANQKNPELVKKCFKIGIINGYEIKAIVEAEEKNPELVKKCFEIGIKNASDIRNAVETAQKNPSLVQKCFEIGITSSLDIRNISEAIKINSELTQKCLDMGIKSGYEINRIVEVNKTNPEFTQKCLKLGITSSFNIECIVEAAGTNPELTQKLLDMGKKGGYEIQNIVTTAILNPELVNKCLNMGIVDNFNIQHIVEAAQINPDIVQKCFDMGEKDGYEIKAVAEAEQMNPELVQKCFDMGKNNGYDIKAIVEADQINHDLVQKCFDIGIKDGQNIKAMAEMSKSNPKLVQKYFDMVDNGELTPNAVVELLANAINMHDYRNLCKKLGAEKVSKLSDAELYTYCNLVGLCNVNNINEIRLADKKAVLKALISANVDMFEASDELRQHFPLLPKNQEEYCTLLPQLVRSLGIETNELKPEQRIIDFNNNMHDLGKTLAGLSNEEFTGLHITQEFSKDDFIRVVLDKTKDLSSAERQKVFDYFGFELHHNKETQTGYSIMGYPVNLNNGKKLAQIENPQTKAVVENLRPDVVRFSENNPITSNNKQIETLMNKVVEILPELRTAIGRKQHGTHQFDIISHSLKVMQKISQDPAFKELNTGDQKIMLLASLLHDITKLEGYRDKTHAEESSFDTFFISKKLKLSKEEQIKLYKLIKHHECLGFVNSAKSPEELTKRLQSVAFDLQQDNLFDLALIFTHADLKAVKADESFHDIPTTNADGSIRSYGEVADAYAERIKGYVAELKTTQPLLPVTKFPTADRIRANVTQVNPDGSTNIRGLYIDKDGLVIIKFNEVKDWESLGFPKGTTSRGITTTVKSGEADTGNIKFFVHGLDYSNQLARFDAFSLVDSDALLSVSYAERPESKYRFFRPQGVLLDVDTKYVYGGGETDAGSGCGKNIQEFKNNYIFGGERESDRTFIANLIKDATGMTTEEYTQFVEANKNKSMLEIEPADVREKIIKAFATINSHTRRGERSYNEMYVSNPNVMGVFTYAPEGQIENPTVYLPQHESRLGFLKKYAQEKNLPFIVFGESTLPDIPEPEPSKPKATTETQPVTAKSEPAQTSTSSIKGQLKQSSVATTDDLKAVQKIDRENFTGHYEIDADFGAYESDLKAQNITTKVFKDAQGKVIGYYQLEPVQDGELYIYSIGVPKDLRNSRDSYRVLKSMQEEIANFVKDNGIKKVALDVDADNQMLVKLYKKFGFEITDESSGVEDGNPYHDYHMEIDVAKALGKDSVEPKTVEAKVSEPEPAKAQDEIHAQTPENPTKPQAKTISKEEFIEKILGHAKELHYDVYLNECLNPDGKTVNEDVLQVIERSFADKVFNEEMTKELVIAFKQNPELLKECQDKGIEYPWSVVQAMQINPEMTRKLLDMGETSSFSIKSIAEADKINPELVKQCFDIGIREGFHVERIVEAAKSNPELVQQCFGYGIISGFHIEDIAKASQTNPELVQQCFSLDIKDSMSIKCIVRSAEKDPELVQQCFKLDIKDYSDIENIVDASQTNPELVQRCLGLNIKNGFDIRRIVKYAESNAEIVQKCLDYDIKRCVDISLIVDAAKNSVEFVIKCLELDIKSTSTIKSIAEAGKHSAEFTQKCLDMGMRNGEDIRKIAWSASSIPELVQKCFNIGITDASYIDKLHGCAIRSPKVAEKCLELGIRDKYIIGSISEAVGKIPELFDKCLDAGVVRSAYDLNSLAAATILDYSLTRLESTTDAASNYLEMAEKGELTVNAIPELISNRINKGDYDNLVNKMGKENVANLSIGDIFIACNAHELYKINDFSELSVEAKKSLLEKFISINDDSLETSDEIRKDFPLTPKKPNSLVKELISSLAKENKSYRNLTETLEFLSDNASLLQQADMLPLTEKEITSLLLSPQHFKSTMALIDMGCTDVLKRAVELKYNGYSEFIENSQFLNDLTPETKKLLTDRLRTLKSPEQKLEKLQILAGVVKGMTAKLSKVVKTFHMETYDTSKIADLIRTIKSPKVTDEQQTLADKIFTSDKPYSEQIEDFIREFNVPAKNQATIRDYLKKAKLNERLLTPPSIEKQVEVMKIKIKAIENNTKIPADKKARYLAQLNGQMQDITDHPEKYNKPRINENAFKPFAEQIEAHINVPNNQAEFNSQVYKMIYETLNITPTPELLGNVHFDNKYLARLFAPADERTTTLISQLMDLLKQNPNKPLSEILDQIIENQETHKLFTENGLDYEKWIKFDKDFVQPFTVIVDVKEAVTKAYNNLSVELESELAKKLKPEEIAKLGKIIESFNPDKATAKELIRIIEAIEEEIQSNEYWQSDDADVLTFKDHVRIHKKNIKATEKLKDTQEQLSVRLWDNDDIGRNIFFGNHVGCCTSIGAFNDFAAPQHLMNSFVNGIEIVDRGGNSMGNSMCYFAKVDGELTFIIDSFEANGKLGASKEVTDALIDFAQKVCVKMGRPDANVMFGPNFNKINLDRCIMTDNHTIEVVGRAPAETYIDCVGGRGDINEPVKGRMMYEIPDLPEPHKN